MRTALDIDTTPEEEVWLTTSEAARRLGRTAGRVRQLVLEGRIKATKRGRDLGILDSDLDRVHVRPYIRKSR